MPNFTIKEGGKLKHNGKFYGPGDSVQLNAEDAAAVAHVLVPPAKPAPKKEDK